MKEGVRRHSLLGYRTTSTAFHLLHMSAAKALSAR